VRSRNLVNEEAMAHWGLLLQNRKMRSFVQIRLAILQLLRLYHVPKDGRCGFNKRFFGIRISPKIPENHHNTHTHTVLFAHLPTVGPDKGHSQAPIVTVHRHIPQCWPFRARNEIPLVQCEECSCSLCSKFYTYLYHHIVVLDSTYMYTPI